MSLPQHSFIEHLDAVAPEQRYPLIQSWIEHVPLPLFEALRTHRPILETDVATLVARHEDVHEVLRIPSVFTVDLYKPSVGEYMLALDGTSLHTREKGVMRAMLNRDDLPDLRARIGGWASELLESAAGSIDLVGGFGRQLPITVVQQYFGLDGIDPQEQIKWSYSKQLDTFHNQPFDQLTPEESDGIRKESDAAGAAIGKYIAELIPRRLGELKSGRAPTDVVSRMLQTQFAGSVDFPIERLARNIGGLLVGAVETTSQAIAQIVQELFRRPEVLADARDAAYCKDLARFDSIVWEALRFRPINAFLPRLASRDHVLAAGTDRATLVPAGKPVMALTWSAMFDPGLFPDPNLFRIGRPFENYLHFGYGMHECLGKHVGMVMIPEAVRQVVLRPGVEARGELDFRGTPYPQEYQVGWSVG